LCLTTQLVPKSEKQQHLSLFAGAHAPLIRHDNYQLLCQQQHSAGISYFDGPDEGQHPVRERALATSPSTTPAACLWAFADSKHQWCSCTTEGGAEQAGGREASSGGAAHVLTQDFAQQLPRSARSTRQRREIRKFDLQ
jgi:hypothetical protein